MGAGRAEAANWAEANKELDWASEFECIKKSVGTEIWAGLKTVETVGGKAAEAVAEAKGTAEAAEGNTAEAAAEARLEKWEGNKEIDAPSIAVDKSPSSGT